MYGVAVTRGPPDLAGSWLGSSSESPASDMVSTSWRMTAGAFVWLKPTACNSLGLMVSKGVAARRMVDTHLA